MHRCKLPDSNGIRKSRYSIAICCNYPPWPPVQLPKYFLQSPNLFYDLVEWVGSGAPVGEEHAEANRLEQARHDTDSNLVDWTLLGDDL